MTVSCFEIQLRRYVFSLIRPRSSDDQKDYGQHGLFDNTETNVCHILDRGMVLTLYKTLILPVFNYCNYMYFSLSSTAKKVFQKLQNCAFVSTLVVDKMSCTFYTHNTLDMETRDEGRNELVEI